MANISIHRCTLRIVRHGGWGWGPDPHRLSQIAIKVLPELIARELAKLWTDDADLEFTAPVSLRIPLTLVELLSGMNASSGIDSASSSSSSTAQVISERISLVARKAFLEQTGSVNRPEIEEPSPGDHQMDLAPDVESGGAILQVLLLWHSQGVLASRLTAFSVTAVEAWLDRLIQNGSGPGNPRTQSSSKAAQNLRMLASTYRSHRELKTCPPPPITLAPLQSNQPRESLDRESIFGRVSRADDRGAYAISDAPETEEAVERLVFDIAARLQTTSGDRAAILRRRLIVVAEVMIQLALRQCTPALLAALDRALPIPGNEQSHNSLSPHVKGRRGATLLPEHLPTEVNRKRASIASVAVEPVGGESDARIESANQSEGTSSDPLRASDDRGERASPSDRRNARSTALTAGGRAANGAGSFAKEFPSSTAAAKSMATRVRLHPQHLQAKIASRDLRAMSVADRGQGRTRQISSALPFLLLEPLSRLGYLKALNATMEAAGELPALPLVAAALAYKVLAPPARGWRRTPDSIGAATAFAALSQPPVEPALVQLAQNLSPHLSPLDAVLSGALISGHNQQRPLLLLRTGAPAESGFLLVDVEGTLPIQWAASASGLRQVLIQLDSSIVLIPNSVAEPKLLRWFDEEGFHFITSAVPTRGEHWRTFRRSPRQPRWWTNEPMTPDVALLKLARATSAAEEEAKVLWNALTVLRPSIPLAGDATLDHHLTMAAAVAMGTIGWELWSKRESTTPMLALERFGDLPASVTETRDSVRVCLPLGKRFQDLRDHGLLDDVIDVPWFHGRTLTFSTS